MSGTYLYLLSPDVIAETNRRLAAMLESEEAFQGFLASEWGEHPALDRYPHERFVRDWGNRQPSDGIYYLAHPLVNRREIPSFFMNVELHLLLMECYWLGDAEWDESSEDELVERILDVRDFRAPAGGQEAFRAWTSENAFPETFARDLWLLNKLCRRRDVEADDDDGDGDAASYPVWIIAGWENYEGSLTGKELAQLSTHPQGFLEVFRRAVESGTPDERWQTGVIDRILEVRSEALALGEESLCLAISSV